MELKSNELRLGNFVLFNDSIDIICEIGQANNGFCENNGYFNFGKGTINPIPLTEEILLSIEKNSIFNNGFDYKKTSTGRFEIYVGMSLITVVEFLHELQNLNFALLDEELIINL